MKKYLFKLILSIFIVGFVSCNKSEVQDFSTNSSDKSNTQNTLNPNLIAFNVSPENKTEWLKNFQQYLVKQKNEENPSTTYTQEEAIYGLEYLFNYAYSDDADGNYEHHMGHTISMTGNWYSLYTEINDDIDSMKQNSPNSVFNYIDISLGEENGLPVYKTNTVFISTNPIGATLNPTDCGPFDNTLSYPIGVGGWDGDVTLDEGCGECQLPESPDGFALEQIESVINQRFKFHCPAIITTVGNHTNLDIPKPAISDVVCKTIDFPTSICLDEYEVLNLEGGSCLSGSLMNCLYCTLTQGSSSIDFMNIPSGYELLSVNNWQDFCFCENNSSCDYPVRLNMTYCYAKMDCDGDRHPVPDPLEVIIK